MHVTHCIWRESRLPPSRCLSYHDILGGDAIQARTRGGGCWAKYHHQQQQQQQHGCCNRSLSGGKQYTCSIRPNHRTLIMLMALMMINTPPFSHNQLGRRQHYGYLYYCYSHSVNIIISENHCNEGNSNNNPLSRQTIFYGLAASGCSALKAKNECFGLRYSEPSSGSPFDPRAVISD